MKKLAISVNDFKRLRESDAYFVDKSLFIKEIIEDRSEVLLFPRPRHFWKTLSGIIMEMKMIHPHETTETAIEAALKQIEDRQYETILRQQGCTNIMKIAVTFDGKRVWAKTAE